MYPLLIVIVLIVITILLPPDMTSHDDLILIDENAAKCCPCKAIFQLWSLLRIIERRPWQDAWDPLHLPTNLVLSFSSLSSFDSIAVSAFVSFEFVSEFVVCI